MSVNEKEELKTTLCPICRIATHTDTEVNSSGRALFTAHFCNKCGHVFVTISDYLKILGDSDVDVKIHIGYISFGGFPVLPLIEETRHPNELSECQKHLRWYREQDDEIRSLLEWEKQDDDYNTLELVKIFKKRHDKTIHFINSYGKNGRVTGVIGNPLDTINEILETTREYLIGNKKDEEK